MPRGRRVHGMPLWAALPQRPGGVGLPGAALPSKYSNKATVVDGIRFASKAEAKRYSDLVLREKAGEITQLRRQVRYPLKVGGQLVGHYVADFVYVELTAGGDFDYEHPVVEDVKGMLTDLYRWKRRHFEAQYGFAIHEVKA